MSKKRFSELIKGDRFIAFVKDIRPDMVLIELENGETVTARSLVLPEARIGEHAIFNVKDNINGQILLEMVKDSENITDGDSLITARQKRRSFDMRV